MKFALIENGEILITSSIKREGYVEVGDSVVSGQIYNAETGLTSNPAPKEKTTIEKIRDLELSITERNKQESILGDEYAIAIIQSVRDQIEALRDQL